MSQISKIASRGIKFVTLLNLIKAIGQILVLYSVSKNVSQSEVILAGLTLSFISIAQVFAEFGLNSSLMYYGKDEDEDVVSTLFWLNLLFSLLVMLLLIIFAAFISDIYKRIELTNFILLASCIIPMNSISSQLKILKEREIEFQSISLIEINSSIIGVVVAIILLNNNFGVISVILGAIVNAAVLLVLLWTFCRDGWVPKYVLNITKIKKYFKFGLYTFLNNIIGMISHQADILVTAFFFNSALAGAYSLFREFLLGLSRFTNPIVTRVYTPVFVKSKSKSLSTQKSYHFILYLTAFINVPSYAAVIFYPDFFIELIFNSDYLIYKSVLQLISVWALFRSLNNPVGALLIGYGRAKLSFYWNFVVAFLQIVLIAGIAGFGIFPYLIALNLFVLMITFATWRYLVYEICEMSLSKYVSSFYKQLIGASFATLLVNFIDIYIPADVVIHVAVFFVFYLMMMIIFDYSNISKLVKGLYRA